MLVYRGSHDELVVELRSDEQLGVIDTGFLEDYYGTDGQLSLHHLASGVRYSVLMLEAVRPGVAHFFEGVVSLGFMPNGDYQVEGLVRDLLGHYTVLSDHYNPPPGAQTSQQEFAIVLGQPQPPRSAALAMYRAPAFLVTQPTALAMYRAPAFLITQPTAVYLEGIERTFFMPSGGQW